MAEWWLGFLRLRLRYECAQYTMFWFPLRRRKLLFLVVL